MSLRLAVGNLAADADCKSYKSSIFRPEHNNNDDEGVAEL